MSSAVEKFKVRQIAAIKLTVEELLLFSEEEMPARKTDEGDTAYINRINKISAAKKKALTDISDLLNQINKEELALEELRNPTKPQPVSKEEEPKEEKDVKIPTPESSAT